MTTHPQPPTSHTPAPFPPGHPDGPPLTDSPPPGMTWRTAPDGTRYLDYADQPTPATPTGQPVPAVPQPIPTWAKTTALLMATASGSAAIAAWGLSTAADSLAAIAEALWALAAMAAVIAFVVLGVVRAIKRPPAGDTTATATATATGRTLLGGRVTATATVTAKAAKR